MLKTKIRNANKTELKILSEIPRHLRRHWSRCVSTALALFLSAQSEADSWRALEVWTKLKSVLVLPIKGGSKRRSSTYKFYEKRMLQWIAGDHDLCWTQALDIKTKRTRMRHKARSKKNQPPTEALSHSKVMREKGLKKIRQNETVRECGRVLSSDDIALIESDHAHYRNCPTTAPY